MTEQVRKSMLETTRQLALLLQSTRQLESPLSKDEMLLGIGEKLAQIQELFYGRQNLDIERQKVQGHQEGA